MPFHIPPLTRRQFLKGSLLAGASLAFQKQLAAAETSADPHSWALLADPHIHADRTLASRGVNMADNFAAVARELTSLAQRPAAVLVNGDCAFLQGEPGDYSTFAGLLEPLRAGGLPLHLTLGNHDARDTFRRALPETIAEPSLLAERYVALVRGERANWFLLDSLDQPNHTPGVLGDAQRAWLEKALDENAGKPAVVVAHHNLQDGKHKGALLDTGALLEIIVPRRHVKAYIYGHTHDWHVTPHESGIHLINLPPVAYVFTPGKPNGWVLATIGADGVRLALNCLDRAHPQHGEIKELQWRAA